MRLRPLTEVGSALPILSGGVAALNHRLMAGIPLGSPDPASERVGEDLLCSPLHLQRPFDLRPSAHRALSLRVLRALLRKRLDARLPFSFPQDVARPHGQLRGEKHPVRRESARQRAPLKLSLMTDPERSRRFPPWGCRRRRIKEQRRENEPDSQRSIRGGQDVGA